MATANDNGSFIKNKGRLDKLSKTPVPSIQHDLFTTFLSPTNEPSELSNLLSLWDSVPKYHISNRRQHTLRKLGHLPIINKIFSYNETEWNIEITPATVKRREGEMQYYPSENEELVEDVLRKIFLDQAYGMHDAVKKQVWVKFSVRMIRDELKALGKTRSGKQVRLSLEILRKTDVVITQGRRKAYAGTVLSKMLFADREKYLETGGDALCYAEFATPVYSAIESLNYKQFNYKSMMSLKSQLSRWIYKLLSYHYHNASFAGPSYKLAYSVIELNSGILHSKLKTDNFKQVRRALDDLIDTDNIRRWKEEKIYKGNSQKIVDIIFIIEASQTLGAQIRAANKRNLNIRTRQKELSTAKK